MISAQLRRAIKRSDMSRYELSKRSGVGQAAISRFLSGERDLRLRSVDQIAKALKLTLVDK